MTKTWILSLLLVQCAAFSPHFSHQTRHHNQVLQAQESSLQEDAARYQSLAQRLREELAAETEATPQASNEPYSKWSVPYVADGVGYRLYVDIGREEGTWMDPRWGASGRRIEFTMDVAFRQETPATKEVQERMVKDNFGGKSSPTLSLESANLARLRGGFDEMKCFGGGYRVDVAQNRATARFHVLVDGTPEGSSVNGDIFVPEGGLYFSLPCFGSSVSMLSKKEGPVTVRQVGWHTGWRREESRIVGTFRAVPITEAQQKDGF